MFPQIARSATSRLFQTVQCRATLSTCTKRPAIYAVQSEEEFQEKVMGGDKPVVIDFSATWCGPCKMLTPRT